MGLRGRPLGVTPFGEDTIVVPFTWERSRVSQTKDGLGWVGARSAETEAGSCGDSQCDPNGRGGVDR